MVANACLKPIRIAGIVLVALLLSGLSDAGSGRAAPATPANHNCVTNANGWVCTLTVTPQPGRHGDEHRTRESTAAPTAAQTYQLGPNNPFANVTLTATAASGWQFSSWTGCSTSSGNVCTVRVEHSHVTVTPTFTRTTYRLTVTAAGTGSGTVTGSGISCPGDCVEDVATGASVLLTQTTGAGSTFAGWGGSCSGTASTCSVAMSADRYVTATFNAPTGSDARHARADRDRHRQRQSPRGGHRLPRRLHGELLRRARPSRSLRHRRRGDDPVERRLRECGKRRHLRPRHEPGTQRRGDLRPRERPSARP